ncbi:radical SAM protein [Candidatus Poribacteria bacterium]|nr:MAG: radical SAM protein [Candidatus Poribacteria bacterium]
MSVERLKIPEPISGGIILSYRCNSRCKHCMYACSPRWKGDWMSEEDAGRIIEILARKLSKAPPGLIGVNYGVHLTGGEPFLNFELLLKATKMAEEAGLPFTFVETNCFWCRDDRTTREMFSELKAAGLDGVLISVNPFLVEYVPFERIKRAVRIAEEVFGGNVMVYQRLFYELFDRIGLKGTLSFEEYLRRIGRSSLAYMELLPMGRAVYKLAHLFKGYPASKFFGLSCRRELIRDWHIHIDNYCNFIPGYCGGISLGDARELDKLCSEGIDLEEMPILKHLLTDLEGLYRLAADLGYEEREEGYISKCHLCLDIRRYLVRRGSFPELKPIEFYEHLDD